MLKNFLNEFKTFALKGNVLDMAIGIIIGANFSKIVDSLVKDILMPGLGWLLGNVDFSDLKLSMGKEPDMVTINYGLFLNAVISFTIIAFAVFLLVKAINKLKVKKKEEPAPAAPTTKKCPYCCMEVDVKAKKCPHCTSDLRK